MKNSSPANRTLLVTGASRGIGHAIATKLLENGYSVIGVARKPETISHPNYTPHSLDLNTLIKPPQELLKLHPTIDGIVLNAGRGLFGNLEQLSPSEIEKTMHLNFLSHVHLIKTFLPTMKKRKSGDILFIGSESALEGKREGTIYCATKWALRGFAKALRDEVKNHGIRVMSIHPGLTDTPFFDKLHFRPENEVLQPEQIAHLVHSMLLMPKGCVVDEISLSPQTSQVVKNY